jgi:CHAD domain-containing protein
MPVDLNSMKKSARRIARFLEKNPKAPSADAIHKLRASARSVATMLAALELDSGRLKRIRSELSAIRKLAGKVRDVDVWTANALTVEPSGERDCLVSLVEELGARRGKSAKKLRRLVRATGPRLRRDVKRGMRRAEKLLARSKIHPAQDNAAAGAAAQALRISAKLNRPGRLGKNNLHAYRLDLKELRDVLLLAGRAGSSGLLEPVGKVKDAIGDWHDWVELFAIADPLLDHGASCKLRKRLRTKCDATYRRALSLARRFARREITIRTGRPSRARRRRA